ncbi:hypothetical protein R3P38DRAFT_3214763 [Favolaschia claudopus]|uniref:Uncharacterized protein n=1 Tax=Favolaschia claudopus TaxID=2862362 RepID=A0AAW0AAZ4_9AGAR
MSSHWSNSSAGPTLPPLHTLNLLPPSYAQRRGGSPPDAYDPSCPRLHVPHHRRASTSTASSSRTPSPVPSTSSSSASQKLTLIPSSMEDADAVVLVPSPDAPAIPGTRPGQSLLLTGPSIEQFRGSGGSRSVPKGTRLHPYRFANRRRPSAV